MPSRIPTARPSHLPPSRPAYERRADRRRDKAFYKSPAWRRLRLMFLRAHPLCHDCKKEGRLTAAVHVHHIIDRKLDGVLALDWSNLEALCASCHGRKRQE
jgi:5-methylcytosine-specific restriction enzyme A